LGHSAVAGAAELSVGAGAVPIEELGAVEPDAQPANIVRTKVHVSIALTSFFIQIPLSFFLYTQQTISEC